MKKVKKLIWRCMPPRRWVESDGAQLLGTLLPVCAMAPFTVSGAAALIVIVGILRWHGHA